MISMKTLYKQLSNKRHWHYCKNRMCRRIYQCLDCVDVTTNGRCDLCRGTSRPLWIASRDAHDCCVDNCFQVTNRDEMKRYSLAGPGPWYQCATCKRAHGWPRGVNPETGEPRYVAVPRTTPQPRRLGQEEVAPIGGTEDE